MTRAEYIEAIKGELGFMPQEDVLKAEEYFNSFFNGGQTDEEVIGNLGKPKEAAKRYCRGVQDKTEESERNIQDARKQNHTGIIIAVIAAVFLFPIWLPVLIIATTIIFAVFAAVLAVSFGMWLGGGVVILNGLFAAITIPDKLIQCGIGCIMFGVGLILSWLVVRALISLSVWIIRKITRS